jgi:ParB-like chromosome segregation protein Spo0J
MPEIEEVLVSEVDVIPSEQPASGCFPPQSEPFKELVAHIRTHGLLTPLYGWKGKMLHKGKTLGPERFYLISGHYRFWAVQQLGHKTVPVVRVLSIEEATEHLVECGGAKVRAKRTE